MVKCIGERGAQSAYRFTRPRPRFKDQMRPLIEGLLNRRHYCLLELSRRVRKKIHAVRGIDTGIHRVVGKVS